MSRSGASERREQARQALAAAQQGQARAARRRRLRLAGTSVAVVVAVVAALVAVKVATGGRTSTPAAVTTAAGPVAQTVTSTPAAVLARVATGGVGDPFTVVHATELTRGGLPRVVYEGAEYCPFCAAERWPLVLALSRFGTFHHLGLTASSTTDVYPGTPTFTFYGSTYTSPYLDFTPVELETNKAQGSGYTPLQKPTAEEVRLADTYDAPPYVPAQDAGAIPFLDIANRFVLSGASYNPQVLAGRSWTQIAGALADPGSPIARDIDGTANYLTAALCVVTGGRPASVCATGALPGLQASIRAGG